MFIGKKENGIILMENLHQRIPPCLMLDKKKLLSFEQVKPFFIPAFLFQTDKIT